MKVSIIKYNGGNIQSVIFALHRLGIEPIVTDNVDDLLTSDKIIFPGVGEASTCMRSLRSTQLDMLIPKLTQPVLGICVGLQLMCKHSEEGNTVGLGIFDANVKKFDSQNYKIPQMGWNTIYNLNSSLFTDLEDNIFVYFVHSFAAELNQSTIAKTNYIQEYSAALQKNNFYAIQFHAEKSSHIGNTIIKNFISL